MKQKTEKRILAILMLSFAVLFLMLNWMIPFIIDDNVYTRSFVGVNSMMEDTDPNRMVDSLGEFCASMATHFAAIYDRYVVAILAQIFCITDKHVFDVVLTIMLLLLLMLTGSEKGRDMSMAKMSVSLFLMLFMLSYPCVFYEGVVVPVNYVFPAMMVLCLLHCCDRYSQTLSKGDLKTTILLSLLAVVAAWCHECISVPVGGGMCLMLLLRRRKLSKGDAAVYLSFIIATAIMVLGPANLQRFASNNADVSANTYGMGSIEYHLIVLRYMRIAYLWAALFTAYCIAKRKAALGYISDNALLMLSLAVSIPFSLFIGGVNCRVVFGAELISVVLLLRLLWRMEWFVRRSNKVAIACLSACIALISFVISAEKPYISALNDADRQVRESRESVCTLILEPQDTLRPQLQKYIVGTLNTFQKEQIRWKYGKEKVL